MRRQLETKTAKFESLQAKDLELAEQERREAEEILQLKRVIEEMSVEMESVKRTWGTPGLWSEAEEAVGGKDKDREREMEDLREKLSAAERSIHTLNSEIDEENDTIDGLQEEIDKLVAQLEDTHSHDEDRNECRDYEEAARGRKLSAAESSRACRQKIWSWQSRREGRPRRFYS